MEQEIGFVLVISSLCHEVCCRLQSSMKPHASSMARPLPTRTTSLYYGWQWPKSTSPALQTCTLMYLSTYIQYTHLPLLGSSPSQHAQNIHNKMVYEKGLRSTGYH